MAYASWSVVFGEQPSASKWNILGTNDAYFDSLIGSGTAWTSFTPSWTNLTVGNGTNTGAYQQLGKTVHLRQHFTLGTTSSVGTDPQFTLPVNSINYGGTLTIFLGVCYLNGSVGNIRWISTTAVGATANNTSSTYIAQNGISSTVPLSWTTGNILSMCFTYQAG